MLKLLTTLAIGASALGLSVAADAATTITYTGTQQLGSTLATYSITTDGTLGSLVSVSHVTAYTVSLADSLSTITYGRTSAGGTGSVGGTNFAATATGLTIPFFEALTLFANNTSPLGQPLGFLEFRYNETYMSQADPAHAPGVVTRTPESNITVPFATVSATGAVPEPATWATLMLGVGAAGVAMRRQRARVRVRFA